MNNVTEFYKVVKSKHQNARIVPMWDRRNPGQLRYSASVRGHVVATLYKGTCIISF